MCTKCDPYSYLRPAETRVGYQIFVARLRALVSSGAIELVPGDSDLVDIGADKPWPAEKMTHRFRCPSCSREFYLRVDVPGGRICWDAVEPGKEPPPWPLPRPVSTARGTSMPFSKAFGTGAVVYLALIPLVLLFNRSDPWEFLGALLANSMFASLITGGFAWFIRLTRWQMALIYVCALGALVLRSVK
jgi:hypothetical protein